ncbi:hypothetical protein [Nocardioides maradonensis]
MRAPLRPARHLIAIVLAGLLAVGICAGATAATPAASAAVHATSTQPAAHVAARTIQNCRTSEIPCRYKAVNFAYGSRKFNMIKRELTLRPARSRSLPECYGGTSYVMRVFEDGSSAVRENGCIIARPVAARGWGWTWIASPTFWSNTWKVTKCVSAVIVAVVPMAKAARFVRELGGIRKSAELIVKAGTWADLKAAAPGLAGEILGISAVADACF